MEQVSYYSKEPTPERMSRIARNIRQRYDVTCFVRVSSSDYKHYSESLWPIMTYELSLVPGSSGENCDRWEFKTWKELLQKYRELMEND